jgi:hypothetical protein
VPTGLPGTVVFSYQRAALLIFFALPLLSLADIAVRLRCVLSRVAISGGLIFYGAI